MTRFNWPDARGWIGIGIFCLTVGVMLMLMFDATLRANEFFKTIATFIVGAYVKDVVGWAYSATKSGGELAAKNADIVQASATASNTLAASTAAPVEIVQPADRPVPTRDAGT